MPVEIHPSAVVSPRATLGDGTRVGPYCVIDGEVVLGEGCEVSPFVHLVGPMTMGKANKVGTGTVLGSDPQHLGYQGQPTRTEVGDGNTFREHVTVHRGSHVAGVTKIGNRNYLMAHSHIAHDCIVGDDCILANGSALGGHVELGDRVFLGGNSAIHQFTRLGRLTLLRGCEGVGRDVPPFLIIRNHKSIAGVNLVGLRRAGYATKDITPVRTACRILYKSGLIIRVAIERVEAELGEHPLVAEMLAFMRSSKRGFISSAGSVDEDD